MHTMIAFWLTSRDEMQLIYSQFVLLTRYHYDERIQLTARWGLASVCKIVFCPKKFGGSKNLSYLCSGLARMRRRQR